MADPSYSYVQVPPDGAGKKINTMQTVNTDGITVETQVVHIADHDNPEFIQKVDAKGAGLITFAEGPPSLDAFGNLRVAQGTLLQSYMHTQGSLDDLFTTQLEGTGSVYYDSDNSAMSLRNTAEAGSVLRATDHYHHYQAGNGMLIIITGRMSDEGLNNNIRRWGYYDGQDGLFWELNGTDFRVGRRRTNGEHTTNHLISREDWNGDHLDGTGLSGMTIDLSKMNFFWIDFAWLGVGNVRFGVLGNDGQRIVCHTLQNPNTHEGPYITYPNLPICLENINTSTTTAPNSLEFLCCAVYTESVPSYAYKKIADLEAENVVVGDDTPIMTIRPNIYFPDPLDAAHQTPGDVYFLEETYIKSLNLYTTAPIYLEIFKHCTVSGVAWNIFGESSLSAGTGGTIIDEGREFAAWCLVSGCHNIDLDSYWEFNKLGIHINFDNGQPLWSIVASNLTDVVATVKKISVTYKEIQ